MQFIPFAYIPFYTTGYPGKMVFGPNKFRGNEFSYALMDGIFILGPCLINWFLLKNVKKCGAKGPNEISKGLPISLSIEKWSTRLLLINIDFRLHSIVVWKVRDDCYCIHQSTIGFEKKIESIFIPCGFPDNLEEVEVIQNLYELFVWTRVQLHTPW